MIIKTSHFEERSRAAVGAVERAVESFAGFVDEAADIAHVQVEFCAVFASDGCFALEIIGKGTLECPFARGSLGSVGIHGCEA